ncbi:uncharacterized protein TNIN_418651 [Trichonephila inaurata madagascariensis]|uniref:Uncharacterized protein n=1 Tax=Trichonephila inaurata madagascariensis TaxID=2747483 RepID=A0A8X6JCP1_9ARAC|nr:uncharacterized protein TNIN_418651 [Trichonephila inaurata madagascariensis]
MNSSVEHANFECPSGFSKEDVDSQLFYEDLDDDSELWLIRAPNDMEPNVMENQRMILGGESNIINGSDGASYEYFVEKCAMPNLSLVLPHKESKDLEIAKNKFQGSILITNCIMPDVSVKMEVAENGLGNESSNAIEEDSEISQRKKSKKSKKSDKKCKTNQWRSELNSLIDLNLDSDQISTPQKLPKKHKKKKSAQMDFCKLEPMSDLDEFPNCKSQKA